MTAATTTCREDFTKALALFGAATEEPYFTHRSTRPVERTQQRRAAKDALEVAIAQLAAAFRDPAVRFALTPSEMRGVGRLMQDVADMLELMGVQAGSAWRRGAFRSEVVATDTARFRRFRRNHGRRSQ